MSINHSVLTGNNNIVEMLIKNGADVNVKDEDGKTPLDLANGEGKQQYTKFYLTRRFCLASTTI